MSIIKPAIVPVAELSTLLYDVCRLNLYFHFCPTIRTHDQAPMRSSKTNLSSTLKRRVEHIRNCVLILVIELCRTRVATPRLEVMDRHYRRLLIVYHDS